MASIYIKTIYKKCHILKARTSKCLAFLLDTRFKLLIGYENCPFSQVINPDPVPTVFVSLTLLCQTNG